MTKKPIHVACAGIFLIIWGCLWLIFSVLSWGSNPALRGKTALSAMKLPQLVDMHMFLIVFVIAGVGALRGYRWVRVVFLVYGLSTSSSSSREPLVSSFSARKHSPHFSYLPS